MLVLNQREVFGEDGEQLGGRFVDFLRGDVHC